MAPRGEGPDADPLAVLLAKRALQDSRQAHEDRERAREHERFKWSLGRDVLITGLVLLLMWGILRHFGDTNPAFATDTLKWLGTLVAGWGIGRFTGYHERKK
jgi:hypothetical protein